MTPSILNVGLNPHKLLSESRVDTAARVVLPLKPANKLH